MSSESVLVPVEASVEDLHGVPAPPERIQSDARGGGSPPALEDKLNQELQYHMLGNYGGNAQSDFHSTSDAFLPNPLPVHHAGPPWGQDGLASSSVYSFTKAEAVHRDERWHQPCGDLSLARTPPAPSKPHFSTSFSTPSLPQPNREQHRHLLDRQTSWSTFPVTDTSAPEISPRSLLAPSSSRLPQDPGGDANPPA